jgi:hypothetical protein
VAKAIVAIVVGIRGRVNEAARQADYGLGSVRIAYVKGSKRVETESIGYAYVVDIGYVGLEVTVGAVVAQFLPLLAN